MWTRAALDLRQVALADRFFLLLLNQPCQLLLRDLAAESAEGPFDFAQVPDFLTERHIAMCNHYIAICDQKQEVFSTWNVALTDKQKAVRMPTGFSRGSRGDWGWRSLCSNQEPVGAVDMQSLARGPGLIAS